jgi:hypothetical protein
MYTGPQTPGWDGIDPYWVPITPITASWEDRLGQSLSQTQIPLTPAWAITIHKSQHLTLSKVVIDLGEKDFSPGLSFVAMYCVKDFKGLAFHIHFPWSHLQQAEETPTAKLLREDNEHCANLSFELDTYGVNLNEYVFTD